MRPRLPILLLAAVLVVPALAVGLAVPPAPAHGDVRIVRDAYGVPHVYADDVYGLFWGNGYAQAQDRLFQMDVLRHVGKGESARYLGPGQLDMDLATRRELYTDAERSARFAAMPDDDRQMFQAFSDGVNAWIAKTRADPMLLSAEFYAIAHAPEDWIPEDTIAIAEFLLDIFGAGSGGNELDNAKLLGHLEATLGVPEGRRAFNDLFWMHDASTPTTLHPDDYTYAMTERPQDLARLPRDQLAVIASAQRAEPFAGGKTLVEAAQEIGFPAKFGSNAMLVPARNSESGAPLLLGGPQMAYYNPMVPYEVALHGAGFDAVGMGVGGAPGVIIGRNANLAWTVTSGSSDQVDVVAVKLVDGESRRYYLSGTSGRTAAMDCRTEVHVGPPTAIDQNPPVLAVQEVCRTERGPVFAIDEEGGYAFVRERTHRGDELRSGILWLTLAKNEDLASFQRHMETFRFEFNFHVISTTGDIAYYHWGANPVRDMRCDPRLPRLAGACDWTDVRTGSELPHKVNPTTPYVANWNNKPAMGWSGGDAMEKWGPVHRVELLQRALDAHAGADGKWSIDELKAVNVEISTRSPFPHDLVPLLLAAPVETDEWRVHAAREALALWAADGYEWTPDDATCKVARAPSACFGTHPPGFTIYEMWRDVMQSAVFDDELGPFVRTLGFKPEASSDPHAADHGREDNKDNVLYLAWTGQTDHAWCADVASAEVETCDEIAILVLDEVTRLLEARYGPVLEDWRQDAHTIKFAALSGGPAWRIPMVNRPSFNHYYDFGTGEAGSVLPPGTDSSWRPVDFLRFSADGTLPDAHKRDQLDLYVDFAWKPAMLVPTTVSSDTLHTP